MQWFKIPGFSEYEINKRGVIRKALDAPYLGSPGNKKKPGGLIKLVPASTGYLIVTIRHDDETIKYIGVHVLVAMTFHGPKPTPKHKALHKDDVRINNFYKNIYWGTTKQNTADSIRNGSHPSGAKNGLAKFTADEIRIIRQRHKNGETGYKLAIEYGMSMPNMYRIVKGESYREVE